MLKDNNLCSNEPTLKSIQLENEQRNCKPQPERKKKFKRARTAPSYNQNVCSSNLEVYHYNLLNPNT